MYGGEEASRKSREVLSEALPRRNRPIFPATFCFFLFSHTFLDAWRRDPGNSGRSCQGGVRVSWISRYSCFSHTFLDVWRGGGIPEIQGGSLGKPFPDGTGRDFRPLSVFPFFPIHFGCMGKEGSRKFREVLSGRGEGILDFPLLLFFPYIFGCMEGRRDPGNSGRFSREALPPRNRPIFPATFCFFLFSHTFLDAWRRDPGNSGRSCQGGVRVSWISRYSCFSHTFLDVLRGGGILEIQGGPLGKPFPDGTGRDFRPLSVFFLFSHTFLEPKNVWRGGGIPEI